MIAMDETMTEVECLEHGTPIETGVIALVDGAQPLAHDPVGSDVDAPRLIVAAPAEHEEGSHAGKLPLMNEPEPLIRRAIGLQIACTMIAGWFAMMIVYWSPAHSGVDQNGYLVGGRMFADHFSTGMMPPNAFGFVGKMWIGTDWGAYYPKYPIGLPIIYAACIWLGRTAPGAVIVHCVTHPKFALLGLVIFMLARLGASIAQLIRRRGTTRLDGWITLACLLLAVSVPLICARVTAAPEALGRPEIGANAGVVLAYLISPLAMALALLATFFLVRLVAGSFAGLMGILVVAASPVTLDLTNNPNSHAATLCCVSWGMLLLIRWWQSGGAWRATFAGLLLGYAVTIRYTEGLLVIPMLLVATLNLRRGKRAWAELCMLLGWWMIPVLSLVCFNLGAFGHITGYDPTNESTGFDWLNFQNNWELTVRQFYNTGLFLLIPIALLGLIVMFAYSARFAAMLCAWLVPSLILYTAYYWSVDNQTTGYMRFYLTLFPALVMPAMWLLWRVVPAALDAMVSHCSIARTSEPLPDIAPRRARRTVIPGGVVAITLASLLALIGVMLMSYSYFDAIWTQQHPLKPGTVTVEQTRGGGGGGGRRRFAPPGAPLAGAVSSKEAVAEARKAEQADDSARLGAAGAAALRHIPIPAGALLAIGAVYLLVWRVRGKPPGLWGSDRTTAVGAFGCGLLALGSAAMGFYTGMPDLDFSQQSQGRLDMIARMVAGQNAPHVRAMARGLAPSTRPSHSEVFDGAPAGSLIFSNDDSLLHHLQFIADYQIYSLRDFNINDIQRSYSATIMPPGNDTQPQTIQPQHAERLYKLMSDGTQRDVLAQGSRIVHEAIRNGHHVYVVTSGEQARSPMALSTYFPAREFTLTRRDFCDETPPVQSRRPRKNHWMGIMPRGPKQIARDDPAAQPIRWTIYEITPVR